MINLIHGDCLIEMQKIADKSVDMILCDLPYGTTACKWDVVIPFDQLWAHYKRVIKDNGAIVLFGSEPFSSHLRMSNIKEFKYDWIWEKDKGSNIGNSRREPLKKHEIISVFYKNIPTYDYRGEELKKPITRVLPNKIEVTAGLQGARNIDENGERRKATYTHETKKSVLYFPRESQFGKSFHPTQKPVALLEYLIKTYTNEDELVLDNCMGSGSTGVACKNLNRRFLGIEKEEKYFKIAEERIHGKKEVKAA